MAAALAMGAEGINMGLVWGTTLVRPLVSRMYKRIHHAPPSCPATQSTRKLKGINTHSTVYTTGTRFMATKECPIKDGIKEALVSDSVLSACTRR